MVTWPARVSAPARSRDGARPRSTSATSRRSFLAATLDDLMPAAAQPTEHQRSAPARDDEVGDCAEPAVGQTGLLERTMRARQAVGGERPRTTEAEQRWVGRLRGGGILARALAKRCGI